MPELKMEKNVSPTTLINFNHSIERGFEKVRGYRTKLLQGDIFQMTNMVKIRSFKIGYDNCKRVEKQQKITPFIS